MKKFWKRGVACALLGALLLIGCKEAQTDTPAAPAVEETDTEEDSTEAESVPEEEADGAETEAQDLPVQEEPEARIDYNLTVLSRGFLDIRGLIGTDLFAVSSSTNGKWGVIDAEGTEIFPEEYDFFATDGTAYFSLTKKDGTAYDATLYYCDPATGEIFQVLTNYDLYEYDIVEIDPPYIRLAYRLTDGTPQTLPAFYLEWEDYGDGEADLYTLVHLTHNNLRDGGFDPDAVKGLSAFTDDLTTIGGVLVQYDAYATDPPTGAYYNIIGVNAQNAMQFTPDEEDVTLIVNPYLRSSADYITGMIVDGKSGEKTPAYGLFGDGLLSAAEMTPFPVGTAEALPYRDSGLSGPSTGSGTGAGAGTGAGTGSAVAEPVEAPGAIAYAASGEYVILRNESGQEAVYNMKEGTFLLSYSDAHYTLPAPDAALPILVTQNNAEGYVRISDTESDAETPVALTFYDKASAYDASEQIAMVRSVPAGTVNGQVYVIDRDGRRLSEPLSVDYTEGVQMIGSGDGAAFALSEGGRVYLCIASHR